MPSETPLQPSPALTLRLFGVPGLVVNGRELRLPLQRAVALLAYLACNPGPLPRAHLADVLWPDADEAQGRTRLRRLVYAIEQVIGRGVLLATADSLALPQQAVAVDAWDFTRFARQAVAAESLDEATIDQAGPWIEQARRPLLQGIAFGSDAFDDWLRAWVIEHEHLSTRLIERVADALSRRGDSAGALRLADLLITLDPYREPSYVLLMQLHARQQHRAGVEAAFTRCADALRAEYGITPGADTERAYLRMADDLQPGGNRLARPEVRFAEGEQGAVAYARFGSGERTLVLAPGFVCHVEIALEHPPFRDAVQALAEQCQVILFDRRGVGLSERLRATGTPTALAADILAILDHAQVRRAWLFASSEGGLGAMQLAIDRPERVQGLCLFGSLARGSAAPDYPWALPAPAYDVWRQRLVAGWGGPVGIDTFVPGQSADPALRAWWARLVRHAASPGGLEAILNGLRDADLRTELSRIRVPTLVMHRRGDRAVRFEAGQHLARHIPNAQWLPLAGDDHFWWCGDSGSVVQAIGHFWGSACAANGR